MTSTHHSGIRMSERELRNVCDANTALPSLPIPTQVVSNGEYCPIPQTEAQAKVESLVLELADKHAKRYKMNRRQFLATSAGMATAFLAMNKVHGDSVFDVSEAETTDLAMSNERLASLSGQFIFDVQTHFVRDDFQQEGLLGLSKWAASAGVNPNINSTPMTLKRFKMENYLKEIFLDSDTKISLLSGVQSDDPSWWALSNDQIANACRAVNKSAGSTRMLGHTIVSPGYPGWMDEVDRAVDVLKPASWKCYTIGDPYGPSKYAWRLDDEKLVYPFYEKAAKSGINTICVHKGLMPRDYEKSFPGTWQYATVNDLGKAAKDWPQLNFVIYHSALRPWLDNQPEQEIHAFMSTGYIPWSTDLARMGEKFGVDNVYAELGTSFASSTVTNPRFCAMFIGQLVNLLGPGRVLWGTDSVWYGSPQWQIEALRRLQIPEDIMKRQGWKINLGGPTSKVKNLIFGHNADCLYNIMATNSLGEPKLARDRLDTLKEAYLAEGGTRANVFYGYIARHGTGDTRHT